MRTLVFRQDVSFFIHLDGLQTKRHRTVQLLPEAFQCDVLCQGKILLVLKGFSADIGACNGFIKIRVKVRIDFLDLTNEGLVLLSPLFLLLCLSFLLFLCFPALFFSFLILFPDHGLERHVRLVFHPLILEIVVEICRQCHILHILQVLVAFPECISGEFDRLHLCTGFYQIGFTQIS